MVSISYNTTAVDNKDKTQVSDFSAFHNIISFKVNGEEVKTESWNIIRFQMGNKVQLNITSNMHIDKRTINVNLNGDKAGVYRVTIDKNTAGSF